MNANIFGGIPSQLPDELTEILNESDSVRIERILSQGHRSPDDFWYDQDRTEWVILLRGGARLRFESGEELNLKPGDYATIAAHQRHRVEWTDVDSVWLAVHYRDY